MSDYRLPANVNTILDLIDLEFALFHQGKHAERAVVMLELDRQKAIAADLSRHPSRAEYGQVRLS